MYLTVPFQAIWANSHVQRQSISSNDQTNQTTVLPGRFVDIVRNLGEIPTPTFTNKYFTTNWSTHHVSRTTFLVDLSFPHPPSAQSNYVDHELIFGSTNWWYLTLPLIVKLAFRLRYKVAINCLMRWKRLNKLYVSLHIVNEMQANCLPSSSSDPTKCSIGTTAYRGSKHSK